MDIDFHDLLASLSGLGREKEQEKIEAAWTALRQGQGSCWLVVGQESDVGQNLFARAIIAKQHTGTSYYGRAQALPLFGPYDTWFQCFPDFFSMYVQDIQQKQEKLGADTQCNSNILTWLQPLDLVQSLAQWICQKPLPALIYIEELHNADFFSLQLWKLLRHALQARPVLMLATASYQPSNAPELPPHLRSDRVSILKQLQALHNMAKPKLQSRQEREAMQDIYRDTRQVALDYISEKTIWRAIQSIFHKDSDHDFLVNLAKRAQGNPFWTSQILVYLLDLVDLTEAGWKFKSKEEDIEIPHTWEEICQANLGKLDSPTNKALKFLSCYPGPMPQELWKTCCEYSDEIWEKIFALAYDEGVICKGLDGKTWMFVHDKQRQAVLSQISAPSQKAIHQQLAELLVAKKFPVYRSLYHAEKGNGPDNKLQDLTTAGQYAESLLAPIFAHTFYKEASKEFAELHSVVAKECEEMTQKTKSKPKENTDKANSESKVTTSDTNNAEPKSSQDAGDNAEPKSSQDAGDNAEPKSSQDAGNNAEPKSSESDTQTEGFLDWLSYKLFGYTQRQKQALAKRFLEILRWYRIANLEATPLFTKNFQKLARKIISWVPPAYILPTLWPLVQYLTTLVAETERNDIKEITKSYPKEDVLFLWNLIANKIVSSKSYRDQIGLRKIALQAKLPIPPYPTFSDLHLKMSHSAKSGTEKILHLINSCWLERQEKSFSKPISLLINHLQLCRRQPRDAEILALETYLLHQIGITYERWAKNGAVQNATPEQIQNYWQQAADAYSDIAAALWQAQPAHFMPVYLLQQAYEICTKHELDPKEYAQYLETMRTKYEARKEEQEFRGKGLIICDEEDIAMADHLDLLLYKHNIDTEVKVNPARLEWQKWTTEYTISIVIASSYGHTWEDTYLSLRSQTMVLDGEQKEVESGWGIADLPRHVKFIFWGETPGNLYHQIYKFCQSTILSKYV